MNAVFWKVKRGQGKGNRGAHHSLWSENPQLLSAVREADFGGEQANVAEAFGSKVRGQRSWERGPRVSNIRWSLTKRSQKHSEDIAGKEWECTDTRPQGTSIQHVGIPSCPPTFLVQSGLPQLVCFQVSMNLLDLVFNIPCPGTYFQRVLVQYTFFCKAWSTSFSKTRILWKWRTYLVKFGSLYGVFFPPSGLAYLAHKFSSTVLCLF